MQICGMMRRNKGVFYMNKFKMPSQPPTETKTVRYPVTLIEAIEKAIRGTDCTFSAFVVAAAWFALENLEE